MLTLAASRGAIHALMVELLDQHLHTHVLEDGADRKRRQPASEVSTVFRRSRR